MGGRGAESERRCQPSYLFRDRAAPGGGGPRPRSPESTAWSGRLSPRSRQSLVLSTIVLPPGHAGAGRSGSVGGRDGTNGAAPTVREGGWAGSVERRAWIGGGEGRGGRGHARSLVGRDAARADVRLPRSGAPDRSHGESGWRAPHAARAHQGRRARPLVGGGLGQYVVCRIAPVDQSSTLLRLDPRSDALITVCAGGQAATTRNRRSAPSRSPGSPWRGSAPVRTTRRWSGSTTEVSTAVGPPAVVGRRADPAAGRSVTR